MFCAYHSNVDGVELLAASDAKVQIIDSKGRTALHYAAMGDSNKMIQTLFMASKMNP
jgi:ankyrin repeat protein